MRFTKFPASISRPLTEKCCSIFRPLARSHRRDRSAGSAPGSLPGIPAGGPTKPRLRRFALGEHLRCHARTDGSRWPMRVSITMRISLVAEGTGGVADGPQITRCRCSKRPSWALTRISHWSRLPTCRVCWTVGSSVPMKSGVYWMGCRPVRSGWPVAGRGGLLRRARRRIRPPTRPLRPASARAISSSRSISGSKVSSCRHVRGRLHLGEDRVGIVRVFELGPFGLDRFPFPTGVYGIQAGNLGPQFGRRLPADVPTEAVEYQYRESKGGAGIEAPAQDAVVGKADFHKFASPTREQRMAVQKAAFGRRVFISLRARRVSKGWRCRKRLLGDGFS